MNPDLELLLSADEEARARVEAARRSAEARLASAREGADRRRQETARTREAALEHEVQAIGEDADRQVEARRRRRERYVSGLSEAAAKALPAAVEAWVRIVRDGPPGEGPAP